MNDFLAGAAYSSKERVQKGDGEDSQKIFAQDFDLQEEMNITKQSMLQSKSEKERSKKFFDFLEKSDQMYHFLEAALDYCKELFRLEAKQQSLDLEAKQSFLPVPQLLQSEKRKLTGKAKRMANKYSWILFSNKDLGNHIQERLFYENFIEFTQKTLHSAFDDSDIPKLDEELHRLFRSNAFNQAERLNYKKQRLDRFPALRETKEKERLPELILRLEKRMFVPQENMRQSYLREKREIRPLFTRLTPHGAVKTRSPLVSLLFPSSKEKIRIFEEEKRARSEKEANKTMRVKAADLSRLVEDEQFKMNSKEL